MLDRYLNLENACSQIQTQDTEIQYEEKFNCGKHQQCTQGIFVEPMKWMSTRNPAFMNIEKNLEKIHCEKCNTKVGSFGWLNSIPCPCGVVMGPPGFLIQLSRVDRCAMVKVIEASI